jgi:hypothetical protein
MLFMLKVIYANCHKIGLHAQCHYDGCHYDECHNDECHYDECHYDECHYDECHYAECHYDECLYAKCFYDECLSTNDFSFVNRFEKKYFFAIFLFPFQASGFKPLSSGL